MKTLTEHLKESMICELSSEFLMKAAHSALDKQDIRRVKLFMKGAQKRKKEEDAELAKQYISLNDFNYMASLLDSIFEKYCKKMFKKGWEKHMRVDVYDSGGSRYEGTDWDSYATVGTKNIEYLKNNLKRTQKTDVFAIWKEYKQEAQKAIADFYKQHPDPYNNFITKYATDEEAKQGGDSWSNIGENRDKYFICFSMPSEPHPYAMDYGILGYVACAMQSDKRETKNGGGLGMPAIYITRGQRWWFQWMTDKYGK